MQTLREMFNFHRQRHGRYQSAQATLAKARDAMAIYEAAIAAGDTSGAAKLRHYTESPWRKYGSAGATFSAYGEAQMRWFERPEWKGLRLVGKAHDIAGLDHKGWFADAFEDEVICGVVYQLPGKDGRARYLAGYDDVNNKGAACLSLEIFEGDRVESSWDDDDAKRDAAHSADHIAERVAEEQREYSAAWQAGLQWESLGEELRELRRGALALIREVKQEKGKYGAAVCAALRASLSSTIREIQSIRATRQQLTEGEGDGGRDAWQLSFYPSPELRGAFNDGAGRAVL